MKVGLTLACGLYDRTLGLFDGSITAEGIDLNPIAMFPRELFRRQARHAEFDVCEFSLATFLILRDQGDDRFVAIPAFPAKRFRHEHIWVNSHACINSPADLAGRRIGVQEFIQTASVWIRGHLSDDFGVSAEDIQWFIGGYNAPDPNYQERISFHSEKPIALNIVDGDQCIDELLVRGEIDAAFPGIPRSFTEGSPHVRRLFSNFREVEADYFRRTGIFPIMHMVVIRREIYEKHPWIAVNLQKAFEMARRQAFERLDTYPGPLYASLPWLTDHLTQTRDVLGQDYWSYGMKDNEMALLTLARYLFEQGLIRHPLNDISTIFAPETLSPDI